MELVRQPALLPEVEELSWLLLPPHAWEYRSEDVVRRDTENAALRRIYRQSKLFSRSMIPLLTPLDRQAHRLEIHYKQHFPHYDEPSVLSAIAGKMHITTNKVKAILAHIEIVFGLYTLLGWEHLLVS